MVEIMKDVEKCKEDGLINSLIKIINNKNKNDDKKRKEARDIIDDIYEQKKLLE
jgi:hypothetical protein